MPYASSYAPAAPAVDSPPPDGATAGRFGGVVVRGTITEIGAERHESVSLTGSHMARQLSGGCLMAPFRALGVVLGILFAPLRMLLFASLMGGGGRRQGEPDRLLVPVTPFVLSAGTTHYDCIIRGEVRGGFLKLGEEVIVRGHLDRSRVLRADRVESHRTGAVTVGWIDPKARLATARTVAGVVLLVCIVLLLVSMAGGFS